jgi:hypothetical protein
MDVLRLSQIYNFTNPTVHYDNNKTYRETLRRVFFIDSAEVLKELSKTYENLADLDEETIDELTLDIAKMESTMDVLYEMTKDDPRFQNLYDLAGARMFSTDRKIGQSILFSYDYMYLFHSILYLRFFEPEQCNENHEVYLYLVRILGGKNL